MLVAGDVGDIKEHILPHILGKDEWFISLITFLGTWSREK
jgi:hypothetical protein